MYMSLLGFDSAGSATINGLTEINANNVFSDVLYYDAGTVPVNVKTAIDAITVDVTALEADVATLQSEMNAVEADVATLQGEMNAVEADVATLQSDVTALTISTGITAATVAGLVISQAAQDVTIASHTVSIGLLQAEDVSLDNRIVALEVKTSDQTWGALTGTSFSTKVNVGGGSGVVLNTAAACEFNSGITTDLVQSFNNNNLVLEGRGTGDAILKAGGTNRITCADTGTINIIGTGTTTVEGTGIAINATSAGIQTFATTSSLFQSTTTTTLTSGGETEINCVALDINATGAYTLDATTYTLTTTALAGTAMTWVSNTTGSDLILSNATAGAFSIEAGAGEDLIFATTGTGDVYFASTSDVFINPVSAFQVTAGTGTSITSTTGDLSLYAVGVGANLNINGTAINILGATDLNQTGVAATRIGNTTGTLALTGSTNTVLGTTDINQTGTAATRIGNATGTLALTGSTNTVLGTTNINTTGSLATNIGNTGALTLSGSTYSCTTSGNQSFTSTAGDFSLTGSDVSITTTGTSVGEFVVRANTNVDIKANTGDLELNASTTMLIKSGGTNTLEVASANKMVTTSSTTTMTNTNLALTGATTILGTTAINSTGVANTAIGNTTGITTVTGQATFLGNTQFGDASADSIVPNGTLTKPFIIGTYSAQSSYSTTTITPVTTYLGGTLESTKTFTNSATGNFRYIMASVTPFDANGAITLTAGTYMFWLAINFEDAATFNLTDLTMGLTTISSLTSASPEATIIASLPNLTCFFHKTDAGDAATTDSENRVLSSCFNLASSTTVYPFYAANHSVTMDTVTCNTVFVKIGSA